MGVIVPKKLSRQDASEIVTQKLEWILSACAPAEVWLFGSFARGDMSEASDVDLAIIAADEEHLRDCRAKLYRTPRPDMWPQDVLFYTREVFMTRIGGVASLIRQEGVCLYPEDPDES